MVWTLLSQKEKKRIEIVHLLSQEIQTLYCDDVVLKLHAHFVQEFEGQYIRHPHKYSRYALACSTAIMYVINTLYFAKHYCH